MLICCLCNAASAQTAPPAPAQRLPSDTVLYHFFFAKVAKLQGMAAQQAAKGITTGAARHQIKNDAQLTDAEEASLNAITANYRSGFAAIHKQISTLAARNARPLPATVRQQLATLTQQRDQLVADHIQQINTAFGPVRFQVLDAYVRKSILPKVQIAPIPKN
jgi:uncharacterized protein involved in type VI secretion and phage assembly